MLTSYVSPWHSPDLEDFLSTYRRFFEQEVAPWSARWRKKRIVPIAHEAVLVEELSRIGETGFCILPGSVLTPSFLPRLLIRCAAGVLASRPASRLLP
jgi:hypothetical protein